MSADAKIRLWVDGPGPRHWHVEVDGQEISRVVRRATLNLPVDGVATLELEVYPNKIELPESVLMALRARPAEPRWRAWLRTLAFRDERHELENVLSNLQGMRREIATLRTELIELARVAGLMPVRGWTIVPDPEAQQSDEQPA